MAFDVGSVLMQWQSAGIFDYVLPFLLVFVLIFAILEKSKVLGEQKGINVTIAVVIGFLSLRLDIVPQLFSEFFPRLGVGIAVLLVLLILVGMFMKLDDPNKNTWPFWVMLTVGFIIFLVIVVQSFERFAWFSSVSFGGEIVGWIIGAILLVGLIIAIATSR